MKHTVVGFYAISALSLSLSLSLFVIPSATKAQSFSGAFPPFTFSQVLIDPADRLVTIKQQPAVSGKIEHDWSGRHITIKSME